MNGQTITLQVRGPAANKSEAVDRLKNLGFVIIADTKPWREVFAHVSDNELPGRILRGARVKEDMTQARLASETGISQRHISEMENGKRPIGKKTAQALGKALKISYRVFL